MILIATFAFFLGVFINACVVPAIDVPWCDPCMGLVHIVVIPLCRILSEDKAMVEQLHPEMLLREISVKADLPQTAFRKLRQSFIDLGFGVAPDANKERFRSDF